MADSLKAWLDGKLVFDARDPDHTDGGVGLGLWSAYVSFDDFRITGRLDPAWLKQHPDAAKQVAAAPLVGEAEAVPRVFHGRLRRLPDGRVELFYDWSDAAQLKDWVRKAGTQPALADGELRLGGRGGCTMWHAASLVGDMELACEWSVRKAFGGEGSCTVSLCRGPERCYALVLKGANSRIYKNKGTKVIGWLKGSFAIGQWHRARFIRAGDRLEAWVNGVSRKSLRDPELTQGAAALSAWNAEVAYRDVRIVGRLDPAWLNEHPDAAKQVAAAPLADEAPPQPPQPRVGEPGATAREELLAKLKPLWARRAYGEALDAAKRATAEAKEEAAREAMEPCARAAALLAGFWKGVHDGAERLKGKPFHLKGIKYTVAGVKGDSLLLAMGPAQTSRKLSTLAQTDLLALARAGLEAKAGEARLAVGLFLLFDAEPDVAAAHAEFAAAKKAGADADSIPALAGAATAPAFEKALAEAEAKLDAADYDAAAKAIARARGLRPDSKQPAELIDKAFVRVMTQCLACCKSADFAKARSLLRSANALKSKDRDVATLAAWLKAASKPMFTDTFEGKKLGNWEPEVGSWKPLDGKLACTIGSSEGQLYLKGTRPKDFVLTAEVMNQGVGFSYGLLFRHAGKRFLFFVMSDQFNGVNAGGASRWSYGPRGPVDGLKAERVDVPARYDVETKRTYRLTVRCLGKDIECYLDGVLALRLTDEKPAPGKIGLYGHRGDFRFDNFRLYRAVALPKLRCVPLP